MRDDSSFKTTVTWSMFQGISVERLYTVKSHTGGATDPIVLHVRTSFEYEERNGVKYYKQSRLAYPTERNATMIAVIFYSIRPATSRCASDWADLPLYAQHIANSTPLLCQ